MKFFLIRGVHLRCLSADLRLRFFDVYIILYNIFFLFARGIACFLPDFCFFIENLIAFFLKTEYNNISYEMGGRYETASSTVDTRKYRV
jgi:hypothetical protein